MSSTETMLIEMSDAELDAVAAGGSSYSLTLTKIKQVSVGNTAAAGNLGVNASLASWGVSQSNSQAASAYAGNNLA